MVRDEVSKARIYLQHQQLLKDQLVHEPDPNMALLFLLNSAFFFVFLFVVCVCVCIKVCVHRHKEPKVGVSSITLTS